MAKVTPSPECLPTELACELQRLRNVVALAAFASEARRVLTEVDSVTAVSPPTESALSIIRDRRQWWELGDSMSFVLDDVCVSLDALIGRGTG